MVTSMIKKLRLIRSVVADWKAKRICDGLAVLTISNIVDTNRTKIQKNNVSKLIKLLGGKNI